MKYVVVTGAAGFIGSCMLQKLHEEGVGELVAVDDFSKTEKARNTENKSYIHKVNRTEFFSWLEMNAGQVDFIIHLGARTDTTETRWEIFQELNLRGYRMGLYDPEFSFVTSLDGKFENVSSESRILYPAQYVVMQIKMTGYRYFPYDLKRSCYMTPEQLYLASVKSNGQEQYYSMDNEVFLERLKEKEVSYSENSCFRYIYVRGAHEPFIYEAQSPQIENSSYESSIEYCVTMAGTYLQKLKTAGVYDNTAILFLADHGYADNNASFGRQNPILLVKGIGEKHPFKTSEAPISHEDLQQAFRKLLDGIGGSAVFDWEENTPRERRFLFFEYEKEEHMTEYYQTGHAADETTMVSTGRVFDYR